MYLKSLGIRVIRLSGDTAPQKLCQAGTRTVFQQFQTYPGAEKILDYFGVGPYTALERSNCT